MSMNSFAELLETTAAEFREMPDNPARSYLVQALEIVARAARKAAEEEETGA